MAIPPSHPEAELSLAPTQMEQLPQKGRSSPVTPVRNDTEKFFASEKMGVTSASLAAPHTKYLSGHTARLTAQQEDPRTRRGQVLALTLTCYVSLNTLTQFSQTKPLLHADCNPFYFHLLMN